MIRASFLHIAEIIFVTAVLAVGAMGAGCGKKHESANACAQGPFDVVTGASGAAKAFIPDPWVASGLADLSPQSDLDPFASEVALEHLGGRGILQGDYVDVRTNLECEEGFGAFDSKNRFLYPHSSPHFQEALTYYFGDRYRADLDAAGVLAPRDAVKIVAHCEQDDNAYFERRRTDNGTYAERVCLGDSVRTPGAFYSDDPYVVIHELQHATTIHSYSPSEYLNQFWYDEAGALNEAVSDFMALMYLAPAVGASYDARDFSRWALGKFFPDAHHERSARRCPQYVTDADCQAFPAFSAAKRIVSFTYPDGLGWPYADNFSRLSRGKLRAVFKSYASAEEIHNAGIVMEGALWDFYEAVRAGHSAGPAGDSAIARALVTQAVMKAMALLPKPDASVNLSPVTFRGFAEQLMAVLPALGLSASDQSAARAALVARGLLDGESLPANWAERVLSVKVQDDPSILRGWIGMMGGDPALIPETQSADGKLGLGKTVALHFDIENRFHVTAGGVLVTVTPLDPALQLVDGRANIATIKDERGDRIVSAQVMYQKINGTDIVAALNDGDSSTNVPTANRYFATDLSFDHPIASPKPHYNLNTAIWMQVDPSAERGKTVVLRIDAKPSNGETATIFVPLTIQ